MKIKIVILNGNFQLLEKKMHTQIFFLGKTRIKIKIVRFVCQHFSSKIIDIFEKKIDVFAAFLTEIKN